MTSIILRDVRATVMCFLPDSTELALLRNAGVGDISENVRVGISGVLYSPEILIDLAKSVRINLTRT